MFPFITWSNQTVMLARIALLFCLAALASAAVIPKGPNCSDYFLPICTREFSPVCGTDGVTYPNECSLCFDNMEQKVNIMISRRGEC